MLIVTTVTISGLASAYHCMNAQMMKQQLRNFQEIGLYSKSIFWYNIQNFDLKNHRSSAIIL